MEAAYQCTEVALLRVWHAIGPDHLAQTAEGKRHYDVLLSVLRAYEAIANEYLASNVFPIVDKLHAVSVAVHAPSGVDANLKLFDVLGRIAVAGLWLRWFGSLLPEDADASGQAEQIDAKYERHLEAVKQLINNNLQILVPIKDDQAIDVGLAMLLLATDPDSHQFLRSWLCATTRKISDAFAINGPYPCVLGDYMELLDHPQPEVDGYLEEATSGSILYPLLALWSALMGDGETFERLVEIQRKRLPHCTFQLWFPDETSEANLYTNADAHGAALPNLDLSIGSEAFVKQVMGECDHSPQFLELSAISKNWWPLVLVACRHYRYPIPVHFLQEFHAADQEEQA